MDIALCVCACVCVRERERIHDLNSIQLWSKTKVYETRQPIVLSKTETASYRITWFLEF